MFYKKQGKPSVGDIVLCTVKKIITHSVFVIFDEYTGLEGMVNISEVAPGRIRNLRDHVKEGKKIVCKVLHINPHTGNIDLSLRRVGQSYTKEKLLEYKQEEKAEKLLEVIGKQVKKNIKEMYDIVGLNAIQKYGSLYSFFEKIVTDGDKIIDELNIPIEIKKLLLQYIKDKIKPTELSVSATFSLKCYEEGGIRIIKNLLRGYVKNNNKIVYLGAPNYKITFVTTDYKNGESELKSTLEALEKASKTVKCEMKVVSYD